MIRKLLLGSFWIGVCFAQYTQGAFGLYGGGGLTNQSQKTRASIHFGGNFEVTRLGSVAHIPYGFLLEGGYIGPAKSFASGSAIFSANYMGSFTSSKYKSMMPFVTSGYTQLFGTGNGVNYGGGIDLKLKGYNVLRFEVRDYMLLSEPHEHNAAIRIGFVSYTPD